MEQKKDTYLGLIIILGVVATMVMVAAVRNPYEDAAGAAISKAAGKISYVWTDKERYAPGEDMLIRWGVPSEYQNYLREVHLVSEETGGYFLLAKDLETLGNNKLLAQAPDVTLPGRWYVRVTTQPYMSSSPAWESNYLKIGK